MCACKEFDTLCAVVVGGQSQNIALQQHVQYPKIKQIRHQRQLFFKFRDIIFISVDEGSECSRLSAQIDQCGPVVNKVPSFLAVGQLAT